MERNATNGLIRTNVDVRGLVSSSPGRLIGYIRKVTVFGTRHNRHVGKTLRLRNGFFGPLPSVYIVNDRILSRQIQRHSTELLTRTALQEHNRIVIRNREQPSKRGLRFVSN